MGRLKTSVSVGDTEGGSEEQGVREEPESGGLQGCVWEGRLLGGVEVRAAAAAALLRIPESSVGGLGGTERREQVSPDLTEPDQSSGRSHVRVAHSTDIHTEGPDHVMLEHEQQVASYAKHFTKATAADSRHLSSTDLTFLFSSFLVLLFLFRSFSLCHVCM